MVADTDGLAAYLTSMLASFPAISTWLTLNDFEI